MATLMTLEHFEMGLENLYAMFDAGIEVAAATEWAWAERAKPYCQKALEVFRRFRKGQADTGDVKEQFKLLTLLGGGEVLMNERETQAVYCLAEIAHAAAHLGHLVVARSRRGWVDQEYADLQVAYVQFGLERSRKYAEKVGMRPVWMRRAA